MNTKEEAIKYLDENKLILNGNIRLTTLQIQNVFNIYFILTGEKKSITTCSRCILNMIKRIKVEYDKYKSSQNIFNVYKTNFGQLTLKETKTLYTQIILESGEDLNEKLQELKELEKQKT